MPEAGAPKDDDQAVQPTPVGTVTGSAHSNDLLDLGPIGGVSQTVVARRPPGVESRHRRWRRTSAGAIEQQLGHDPRGRAGRDRGSATRLLHERSSSDVELLSPGATPAARPRAAVALMSR
jgi:hypothetical protein